MKKQQAVRMAVWMMILAVVAGMVVLRGALGAPGVTGDWKAR